MISVGAKAKIERRTKAQVKEGEGEWRAVWSVLPQCVDNLRRFNF
jgi:hypothetical protein